MWDIKVLYYGHLTAPKSMFTPELDTGLILDWPYLGFLLQRKGRIILVDTGVADEFVIDGKTGGQYRAVAGRSMVVKALADARIHPEDIETIIYTHLHSDHAAHCSLFPKARFVAQRDEWETLRDPQPFMYVPMIYNPGLIQELRQVNLLLVDGDFELTDGIRLYRTPGHTPGSQTVTVNTQNGVVALVGDLYYLSCLAFPEQTELIDMYGQKHKITPPSDTSGTAYPSGRLYSYRDFYESNAKIRAIVSDHTPEFIIPGHEPSLLVKERGPGKLGRDQGI